MADPSEFADFYAVQLGRLLLFLYKQGASWDESWDAAQDAFVEAMTRWGTLSNPGAWIRTTAYRAYVKRRRRPGEDLRRAVRAAEWLPRPKFDDLDLDEQQKAVIDEIAALPERQSQVMAWTFDGYTPREIADVLDITPEAVRSSLHLARGYLRTRFAAMIDGADRPREGGVA